MCIWSLILFACFIGIDQLPVTQKDIVSISVDETFMAPGRRSIAIIRVKVKEGYHIQANKVSDESLIPVSLQVTPNKFFHTGSPVFPSIKLFRLEGTEDTLNVFDSTFIIQLPIKAMAATKEGKYFMKAKIRYQACTAKICLFPRNIDFDLLIVVQKIKGTSIVACPSTCPQYIGEHV